MSFSNWACIYLGLGTEDPARDRAVIERGGLKTTIVAVPTREAAVDVAVELVNGGAQLIELCGGFGSTASARVMEAVGDRVPVGAVSYSIESVPKLASLFARAQREQTSSRCTTSTTTSPPRRNFALDLGRHAHRTTSTPFVALLADDVRGPAMIDVIHKIRSVS